MAPRPTTTARHRPTGDSLAAASPPRHAALDTAVARWLVGDEGRDAVGRATAALDDGRDVLEVGEGLRARGVPPDRASAVTLAAEARRRARGTYPRADALVLTPSELEQASHPAVSAHRARRFAHAASVVDLCGGAGLDAVAIASTGPWVVTVDVEESRSVLARHAATAAGAPVSAITGDALRPPVPLDGLVHADPSRRAGGRRARRLADYRPPVGALAAVLAETDGWGIVLSPAVDLDDADLPAGELEFVQVGGDLTEAMSWGRALAQHADATATLLPSGEQRSRTGDPAPLPVADVGEWLVEVAPAAVRARLHTGIGAEIGAWRLAARRALLSSAERPPDSPWYAASAVEAVLPLRAKAVRAWLREHDAAPVEILAHGVEVDVAVFWRELGRPPRGRGGRRLHLVRLDEGAVVLVCTG